MSDAAQAAAAATSAALFGLTAATVGNAVIGASQCLQKYALNRLAEDQRRWHDPLWLVGITGNLLGELFGNFVALSYASAAVVAPLGAVSLVINGVLAKLVLRERLTSQTQYGYLLLIVGVLVLLWAAPHQSRPLSTAELADHLQAGPFVVYTFVILTSGLYLGYNFLRRRLASANSYVILAAILGAITIICSKAVSVFLMLTFVNGQSQFMSIMPYVFVVVLVSAALALEVVKQTAITLFDASCFWPLFFAAYNLVAITFSLALSQEIEDDYVMFFLRFALGLLFLWQGALHIHEDGSSGNFLLSTAPLRLHAWFWRKVRRAMRTVSRTLNFFSNWSKESPSTWSDLWSDAHRLYADRGEKGPRP